MLLVNQTRDLVLNMDTVTSLYIEKKTNSIKAKVTGEEGAYHLGTYQSLEDCKKLIKAIVTNHEKLLFVFFPLGGDVDSYLDN